MDGVACCTYIFGIEWIGMDWMKGREGKAADECRGYAGNSSSGIVLFGAVVYMYIVYVCRRENSAWDGVGSGRFVRH